MAAARLLLAALALAPCGWGEGPRSIGAPSYTADSIVNAADGRPDRLGPNTLASIYGKDLSYNTRAVAAADIIDRQIPTALGGVRVNMSGIYLPLLYVSPSQINFLLPYDLLGSEIDLLVERDNLHGPKARVRLGPAAPAIFRTQDQLVIAAHLDGTLVTRQSPARGGEVIVLFATGLGRTRPDQLSGRLAPGAAWLASGAGFSLRLDGVPVDAGRILYAGVAPGFAGLYQINLRLPDEPGPDPELTVNASGVESSGGIRLITTPEALVDPGVHLRRGSPGVPPDHPREP